MSSALVRRAVANFFQAADIPQLNKVHHAPPFWADGSEWNLANGLGSGAIAAVHLPQDSETRLTVPVLTGIKIVEYQVGLMIFYQFLNRSGTLTPASETDWADPLDGIIDGVKDRLRSDPNCGMPATVLQSAQDPADVRVQRDIPRTLPGKVVCWCVVEFKVQEAITA